MKKKQTECVKDMTTFIGCTEEPKLHSVAKWCLWSMILGQILCNEQFFVTVYFKLKEHLVPTLSWTLVPSRSTWSSTRWIKMLIESRKIDKHNDRMIEMLKCRDKNKMIIINKTLFILRRPKKIIWRLSFSLIGANGSLLDFFVWSPALQKPSMNFTASVLTDKKVRCKMQAAKYLIFDKCVMIEMTYSNNDLQ